jgi:hypothetical protein
MPARRNQRRTSVKADVGGAGDERIGGEALVYPRIGYYQESLLFDGVCTKRDLA